MYEIRWKSGSRGYLKKTPGHLDDPLVFGYAKGTYVRVISAFIFTTSSYMVDYDRDAVQPVALFRQGYNTRRSFNL